MNRILTFIRRLRSMSLARMKLYADKAAAVSGRSVWLILPDMVWCAFVYGVGYLDYLTFGFVHLKAAARRTYMTMNDNLRLVRTLNAPGSRDVIEDKIKFDRAFPDLLHRAWLDLREGDAAALRAFCLPFGAVFAKQLSNFGGFGVERIAPAAVDDWDALYARLTAEGKFLLEEGVAQHPGMAKLNASSVNTIRIVTLEKDGEVHVMYALVRMGNGGSAVDNISSGGMYAPLDENGVITAPAFCDKAGVYYEAHPASHTPLIGYALPCFAEAVALVKRAAARLEGKVRYVGWDVAIAADGPLLIEANTIPSYDMCQNYRHLGAEKQGMRPRFAAVLGDEFFGRLKPPRGKG